MRPDRYGGAGGAAGPAVASRLRRNGPVCATPRPAHVSAEALELYLAGFLPTARETHVEEHLADCAWCAGRARAFLAAYVNRQSERRGRTTERPPDAGIDTGWRDG